MIIVETGAGITGANSYASLEQANAYYAVRMNSDWTDEDTATREAALVRATDYIDSTYSFGGSPLYPEQGLALPIAGVAGLPRAVSNATLMLALYALKGPLSAPIERGVSKTTKKLEGVGELTTEFDPAPAGDPYPAITSLLSSVAKRRDDPGAGEGVGALTMRRLTR